MTTQVLADGAHTIGDWVGTAAAVALVFVVAAAVVGLIWWVVQGRKESFKTALLDPIVPISAVVITVGFQFIVHH